MPQYRLEWQLLFLWQWVWWLQWSRCCCGQRSTLRWVHTNDWRSWWDPWWSCYWDDRKYTPWPRKIDSRFRLCSVRETVESWRSPRRRPRAWRERWRRHPTKRRQGVPADKQHAIKHAVGMGLQEGIEEANLLFVLLGFHIHGNNGSIHQTNGPRGRVSLGALVTVPGDDGTHKMLVILEPSNLVACARAMLLHTGLSMTLTRNANVIQLLSAWVALVRMDRESKSRGLSKPMGKSWGISYLTTKWLPYLVLRLCSTNQLGLSRRVRP